MLQVYALRVVPGQMKSSATKLKLYQMGTENRNATQYERTKTKRWAINTTQMVQQNVIQLLELLRLSCSSNNTGFVSVYTYLHKQRHFFFHLLEIRNIHWHHMKVVAPENNPFFHYHLRGTYSWRPITTDGITLWPTYTVTIPWSSFSSYDYHMALLHNGLCYQMLIQCRDILLAMSLHTTHSQPCSSSIGEEK